MAITHWASLFARPARNSSGWCSVIRVEGTTDVGFSRPVVVRERCLANERLHHEALKTENLLQSQRTTGGRAEDYGKGRLNAKNALCGLHVCSRFQMVRKGG